ncbi:MAG: murein biosynthesis integral membrane protein MurJ [Verrucomicrobia bacterium]|nr:murein biosynthesis integral membrane protein MurJ [Verrucomicrobiota bacterium]
MSEPASRPTAAQTTKQVGIIGLAVMTSRVLGLIRDLIIAALFGATRYLDAFMIAFRIPNLLRDLFAEGALSTAFVTVFSQKMAKEGDASAWALGARVASLVTVFMSVLVLLGMAFAPLLVRLQAPGFSASDVVFTATLLRIMYPFILLVSLAALVMGMLNAKGIFAAPAMASSFFNLGSIAGGVAFGWWMDPAFGPRSLIGLSLGTLLGGLLQLGVQLPSLHRAGFAWKFVWDPMDAGVRRVFTLMLPAIIAGSAVQVNVVVNGVFASFQEGAVAWLQYAFRLMQLPLGVFGVAIATVTLPLVSKYAALGDLTEFRVVLARGLRLACFFTFPSAVGLACLADPIIGLIYERGKFDHTATLETAGALRYYALGLVGYSCIKVLAPAFYAIDRRNTPMNVSFLSIGVNLLLNFTLAQWLGWGHRGLALSTSAIALLNFGLLYHFMRQHLGGLETAALAASLGRLAVAVAGMAAVCLTAQFTVLQAFPQFSLFCKLIYLFGTIGLAGTLFLVSCHFLGVPEMQTAVALLRRRLKR